MYIFLLLCIFGNTLLNKKKLIHFLVHATSGDETDPCLVLKTPCSCSGNCGWSSVNEDGSPDGACRTGSTTYCEDKALYGW